MRPPRGPDVEAEIELFSSSAGGRSTPARNGYRPQHRVLPDYQTSGAHHYSDREELAPGDKTTGTITFIAPEAYPHSLRPGDVIDVMEGSRILGRARILRVLNPLLERAG